MPRFAVILAAAGQSSRFRDPNQKKPFVSLDQKPVWLHSAEKFLARSDVGQLIVVVSPSDREDFVSRFSANLAVLGIDLALGGTERHHSVANGMKLVRAEFDFVAVHDAARPCLTAELLESCFSAAVEHGAAIPAIPVSSAVKRSVEGKTVESTVDRKGLFLAQTPQAFRRDWLESAYQRLQDLQPVDEAQVLEQAGYPVAIVPGSPFNIKITTKADLKLASACLKALPVPKFDMRAHPFGDDHLWR